jgi:hypothetical protein
LVSYFNKSARYESCIKRQECGLPAGSLEYRKLQGYRHLKGRHLCILCTIGVIFLKPRKDWRQRFPNFGGIICRLTGFPELQTNLSYGFPRRRSVKFRLDDGQSADDAAEIWEALSPILSWLQENDTNRASSVKNSSAD